MKHRWMLLANALLLTLALAGCASTTPGGVPIDTSRVAKGQDSRVPFNIASYALLLQMVAQVTGLKAGEFIHSFGDAHLYLNHIEQAELQLSRAPYALPRMHINPAVKDIFGFAYEDFRLEGYQAHPHIAAPVAV